jgi:hypothetical protein
MTTDYKLDASIEIRKYLWDQILTIGLLEAEDYYSDNLGSEIVPIIPVQQSPEMNQFLSGKTHIVYDKIGMSYEENWAICCEQILFTIYSTDVSEINQLRNFMTDLFRRMDDSAKDLNLWQGVSDKFKFYSIFISEISPTSPSEEVQGFLSSDVILEVKYARISDVNGRFL